MSNRPTFIVAKGIIGQACAETLLLSSVFYFYNGGISIGYTPFFYFSTLSFAKSTVLVVPLFVMFLTNTHFTRWYGWIVVALHSIVEFLFIGDIYVQQYYGRRIIQISSIQLLLNPAPFLANYRPNSVELVGLAGIFLVLIGMNALAWRVCSSIAIDMKKGIFVWIMLNSINLMAENFMLSSTDICFHFSKLPLLQYKCGDDTSTFQVPTNIIESEIIINSKAKSRPNILILLFDSLRGSMITDELAPHMLAWIKEADIHSEYRIL